MTRPPHPESGLIDDADDAARLDGAQLRQQAIRSLMASFVGAVSGPKRVAVLLLLVLAWCDMWGSFSVANVLSGVIVAVVVIAVGFGGRSQGGMRLVPLLKFAGLVSIDMVTSTLSVMREVLTPTDYTEEGIIAVPLPGGAGDHLLLLFVAITVTPGTAVVAAEADGSVAYLHVLHCDRRQAIEVHVDRLARLAVDAFPMRSADGSIVVRPGETS